MTYRAGIGRVGNRRLPWCGAFALYCLGSVTAFGAGPVPGNSPRFARDILPILEQHCLDCHSGWFPSAGLRLETREQLLAGTRSGPLLVPGEPAKGWLMYTIRLDGGRLKMPPGDTALSPAQVVTLEDWIRAGAP